MSYEPTVCVCLMSECVICGDDASLHTLECLI